ncbi:cupredoxin domain-containing protein [Enterovirga rhinocerotis]|uniref:Putative cupredoxin-like copper-binding protein n=1 Tax=Enterovirga rhinocerotis TaxID=1339210 RepID=A0A4R7CAU9_9HYPH|nr:cupredoxin family protein [Enterovirga rhinocerotis]TDR94156.1 putative cupredoxin-like copper-binding protein [Enterovirga rhinocerotis]
MKTTILLAGLLALAANQAAAGPGHHHRHAHSAFAAGEPGDAKGRARIVPVTMKEQADGSMAFFPASLTVRRGEQVRFVLTNPGKVDHEFVLDSIEGNARHKAMMAESPDMAHDDPNAKRLAPGESHGLVWRFTKAGTFEYACLLPGHYEAGMKGTVTVR